MTRRLPTLAALAALAAPPTPALARPAIELPRPSLRTLQRAVAEARRLHPDDFARVAALDGLRPEFYLRTRARRPEVQRELRRLGQRAILPALDLLALRDLPDALGEDERRAMETGLLEVVGEARDPRAADLLEAAFLGPAPPHVLHPAARGLGRLCGDRPLRVLLDGVDDPGRGRAAIEGLGHCRCAAAASRLSRVALETDVTRADAAVEALGVLGSSWAAAASPSGDGPWRRMAADGLLAAAQHNFALAIPGLARALRLVEPPDLDARLAAMSDGPRLHDLRRLARPIVRR